MKHIATLTALLIGSASLQAQITHTLHVQDDQFVPASLTMTMGDHLNIIFDDADHTFTQVDQATWMSNGSTPLTGGYNFGQGTPNPGSNFTVTPTGLGTIFFVCQIHVDMGMKGTIAVVNANGIEEAVMQNSFTLAPNPVSTTLQVLPLSSEPLIFLLFDAAGRNILSYELSGEHTLSVDDIPVGAYSAEIRDLKGGLLSRQRLVVAH